MHCIASFNDQQYCTDLRYHPEMKVPHIHEFLAGNLLHDDRVLFGSLLLFFVVMRWGLKIGGE